MASFRIGIAFSLFFAMSHAFATCYYPNGTANTDTDFQPCVATTGIVSMCCATNRTQPADECLSNGLCHNPCAATGFCGDTTGGQYWREMCTDPTWNSPLCLKNACVDPAVGGSDSHTVAMSQCSTDGTWCCGGDLTSDACCAMKNRVALAVTIGVSSSTTSSTTSTTTSTTTGQTSTTSLSSSTTTSAPASQSTSATPPAQNSDTGLKVGLGVGISLGVLLIIAAIAAFFIMRRRRPRTFQGQRQPDGRTELDGGQRRAEMDGTVYNELPVKSVVYEVYG